MVRIKHIALGAVSAAVMIGSVSGPAFALSGSAASARCQLVETRLGTILTRMDATDSRREDAYKDAVARVKKELQNAQSVGYDTTQLQTDYQTLNADIITHHTDRIVLEADIQSAKDFAPAGCGDSQGQFVSDLRTAREQLAVVRSDDAKVRSDLTAKIYPDLRAYIKWLQQRADTSTDTNTNVNAQTE